LAGLARLSAAVAHPRLGRLAPFAPLETKINTALSAMLDPNLSPDGVNAYRAIAQSGGEASPIAKWAAGGIGSAIRGTIGLTSGQAQEALAAPISAARRAQKLQMRWQAAGLQEPGRRS
jgi:hypothetical protein